MKKTNKKAFKVSSFSNRRFGNPVRNGSPCLRHEDDVRRKFAFTLAEGATHVGMFDNKRKVGFTLAEVLITLGIIGVVAALTIPTLINNYQTKSWNTAASVFEAKFTETLKTMNVQGQLGKYGKYDSTEGFVEELQKHFKTTKVCDRDHLMQCFEKTITWGDKEADLSNIKESKDFVQLAEGEEDWGTNVMGVQFANGVTGLIAYNPKCKSDPHNNQITGSDCYALLYDTSGFSDPNELGKDLVATANVRNFSCALNFGSLCITELGFVPPAISKAECEANKDTWGISECPVDNDRWAGAVKQCGHVSKLLNQADLAQISNYVYDKNGSETSLNTSKLSEFGIQSTYFYIFSEKETDNGSNMAYAQHFRAPWSIWYPYVRTHSHEIYALCKK